MIYASLGNRKLSDSTLKKLHKDELIDLINLAEANYNSLKWSTDLLEKRLIAVSKHFTTREFNRIMREEIK